MSLLRPSRGVAYRKLRKQRRASTHRTGTPTNHLSGYQNKFEIFSENPSFKHYGFINRLEALELSKPTDRLHYRPNLVRGYLRSEILGRRKDSQGNYKKEPFDPIKLWTFSEQDEGNVEH